MDISIEQIKQACKTSLHFLCTQVLGYKDWDVVHDDMEKFVNKKSRRKLLLIPRGHLKTAIVTKGFAIQSLLKDPDVRILIANQVWDKSREMLYEIKQLLTEKTDLPKLFGDFVSERWREDDIVIRQRRKALAAPTIGTSGVEAELTSSHYDIIILDDLQGEKNFQTAEQREKVKRYYRSMIDLIEPGGLIIVIGTRWHLDDVYQYIIDNESAYYDIEVRKVIEDGKIIFPKKFQKKFDPVKKSWEFSPTHCEDYINYLRKRPSEEFSSQYMNDPIDSQNQIFKKEYFKYWDQRPPRLYVAMTIDPAISEKQSADYFAIDVSGMDENYNIYRLDYAKGHWKVAESIDNIFTMFQKWHPNGVGLEVVAYQKALKSWLEEKQRERGVFFPITELKRNTNETKEFRIKALEPFFRDGKVYHTKWMTSFEQELLSFPKGKHDDECFVAGTRIATLSGDKNIETVKTGDWILTPFGLRKCVDSRMTGTKKVISKLGCMATSNHPFFNGTDFVSLDALTYQLDNCRLSFGGLIEWQYRKLLSSMESSTVSWGRESIISASRVTMRDGGMLRDSMWRFGNFILEGKFVKAFTFITKMAILSTTACLTWSVYRSGNTVRFLSGLTKKKCGEILTRSEVLQKSGTEVLKVMRGILTMPERCGSILKGLFADVQFAGNLSSPSIETDCTVRFHVSADTAEPQESITFKGTVLSAEKDFPVTSILTSKPVLSDVEPSSSTETEKPVYNLTVDTDHVYFADGNLVSNCDAFASQLDMLIPGDSERELGIPDGCWESANLEAQKANQPFRDFFHEVNRGR